jgi:K+-sensing histidine kinase KdpD
MGLSLCYSIVQEHGGEISAFNMHPHGAAVAIELPVVFGAGKRSAVAEETVRRATA